METYIEKRSEPRLAPGQYHSVEIPIKGLPYTYQFKIWDRSSKGVCVVVKEGSEFLQYLKVGDIFDMKYYGEDPREPAESLKTEVRHITKDEEGRFKGHYLVGISILEQQHAAE
jgi:hypothetical protein